MKFLHDLKVWLDTRAGIRQLHGLDDGALHDLGITRGSIESEVRSGTRH